MSILIVNWNVRDLLLACLASLETEAVHLGAQIVVVDNASADGSVEAIRARFPGVLIIPSERNLGFAAGNNLGMSYIGTEHVLLLNPDTLVPAGTLTALLSSLMGNSKLGAISPKVLNADGSYQRGTIRGFPRLRDEVYHLFLLNHLRPKSHFFGHYEQNRADPDESRLAEILTGCCMLVRRSAFDEVGGFDTRLEMYLDDIDLSTRLVKAGWQNYYLADVSIIHLGGQSSEASGRLFYLEAMQSCAMNLYFRKHHGILTALGHRGLLLAAAVFRIALILGVGIPLRLAGRQDKRFSRAVLRKYVEVFRIGMGAIPRLGADPGRKKAGLGS